VSQVADGAPGGTPAAVAGISGAKLFWVIDGSQFKMPQAVYFTGNVFAKSQLGAESPRMQEKPLCSKTAVKHLGTI
jgi:hypothetical protein